MQGGLMFWYKLRSAVLIFSSETQFHFHDLITFGRDAALHQAIIFGCCLGIEAFTLVSELLMVYMNT